MIERTTCMMLAALFFTLPNVARAETTTCTETPQYCSVEQKSPRRLVLEQRQADEEQLYEDQRAERQARNEEYWRCGIDYELSPAELRERNRLAEEIFAEEELQLRLLDAQHRQEQRDFDLYEWRLQNSTFEGQYQLQWQAQVYAQQRSMAQYGPYH